MIFDIIKDATEYTLVNKKYILPLGVLYLLNILILPLVLFEGFSSKIINESLKGTINADDKLKPIKDNEITTLLGNGLKLMIVHVVYFLPLLIALICEIYIPFKNADPYLMFDIVLFLLCLFLCNIASVHMFEKNSLKKAFNIKEIIQIIKQIGIGIYIKLFITILVLLIGTFSMMMFTVVLITLTASYFIGIWDYAAITIILFVLTFFLIELPAYSIFKNRAITTIYNLR